MRFCDGLLCFHAPPCNQSADVCTRFFNTLLCQNKKEIKLVIWLSIHHHMTRNQHCFCCKQFIVANTQLLACQEAVPSLACMHLHSSCHLPASYVQLQCHPSFCAFVLQGGKNQKQDPAYGADVLRLWVASVDYTSDVLIGGRIISQVHLNAVLTNVQLVFTAVLVVNIQVLLSSHSCCCHLGNANPL